jgi:hypothetical protein
MVFGVSAEASSWANCATEPGFAFESMAREAARDGSSSSNNGDLVLRIRMVGYV